MKKILLFIALTSVMLFTISAVAKDHTQSTERVPTDNGELNIKEEAQKLATEINNVDNEIKAIGTKQKRHLRVS